MLSHKNSNKRDSRVTHYKARPVGMIVCFQEYFLDTMYSLSNDDATIGVVHVNFNVIEANFSETFTIYKNLRDGLIQQYSNKGWLLDDMDDIGTLPTYEIQQALDRGTKFYFRIVDPSVALSNMQMPSYILLTLANNSLVQLGYYNPIQVKEIIELENRERNKDL